MGLFDMFRGEESLIKKKFDLEEKRSDLVQQINDIQKVAEIFNNNSTSIAGIVGDSFFKSYATDRQKLDDLQSKLEAINAQLERINSKLNLAPATSEVSKNNNPNSPAKISSPNPKI